MDNPITYREVLARGRRTFELFDDRIIVRVQYPNYSAELTVPLSNLSSMPNTVRHREWPFNVGLILLICPWLMPVLQWISSEKPPAINSLIIACSLGFVGAIMCLYCIRKIEFASFVTHTGTVALDIGDAGPDRARFRTFVDQLLERISAAQSLH